MEIPSSKIDNNISSNEANRIKETREYLTAILRALHYLGHQGLALRGKYDDGNLTNDDVINKGNFKELFNVMCESNDRLRELFEKRKKMPRWSQKLFKMNYCCVRKYILEGINKVINNEGATYFCVVADEVTDCTNWEQLGIAINKSLKRD